MDTTPTTSVHFPPSEVCF